MRQSTNHLLMVQPASFYANPETMKTNAYQVTQSDEPHDVILKNALREFFSYRDMLVEKGVVVTTMLGEKACPDMVFPNWASTYDDGRLMIYPMHSANRSAERTDQIINLLKGLYPKFEDWSEAEKEGLALESTASIVSDHVNKRGYSGLSKRTSPELVEKWADFMGYDVIAFETRSHAGIPVYHTDFLMYIGTRMAGICSECIVDEAVRAKVLDRLSSTHDVIDLSMEQLQANCCNALEVLDAQGKPMLTMSKAAYEALLPEQLKVIEQHYDDVICPDLTTLEKYGGGSARCMLMEMF